MQALAAGLAECRLSGGSDIGDACYSCCRAECRAQSTVCPAQQRAPEQGPAAGRVWPAGARTSAAPGSLQPASGAPRGCAGPWGQPGQAQPNWPGAPPPAGAWASACSLICCRCGQQARRPREAAAAAQGACTADQPAPGTRHSLPNPPATYCWCHLSTARKALVAARMHSCKRQQPQARLAAVLPCAQPQHAKRAIAPAAAHQQPAPQRWAQRAQPANLGARVLVRGNGQDLKAATSCTSKDAQRHHACPTQPNPDRADWGCMNCTGGTIEQRGTPKLGSHPCLMGCPANECTHRCTWLLPYYHPGIQRQTSHLGGLAARRRRQPWCRTAPAPRLLQRGAGPGRWPERGRAAALKLPGQR